MKESIRIATLFQEKPPPPIDGVIKPMKESGYRDSGADIMFNLLECGIEVVTPVEHPVADNEHDWVFQDDETGIEEALQKGANTFWLNTVLFTGHPITEYLDRYKFVGQEPSMVTTFDDKLKTNQRMYNKGLPFVLPIEVSDTRSSHLPPFPIVLKPIRGRGSQGVKVVRDHDELHSHTRYLLEQKIYGTRFMAEAFLPGREYTVTVMPPGVYEIAGQKKEIPGHWCLPLVTRYSHQEGIAPYSGIVAVSANSHAIDPAGYTESQKEMLAACALTGAELKAKAPIRIDGREDERGTICLFDVNLKPNMTGPGRPGRSDQESLTAIAAAKLGWNYKKLLLNILNNAWTGMT